MEEVERYKPFDRYRMLPWDTASLPVPWPLSSPNPSVGRNAQAQQQGLRVATRRRKVGRNNELCCPSSEGGPRRKGTGQVKKTET